MLARLERESGRMDAARKSLGEALEEMTAELGASSEPGAMAIHLKALIESTLLNIHSGKSATQEVGRLLEGVRETRKLAAEVSQGCQLP